MSTVFNCFFVNLSYNMSTKHQVQPPVSVAYVCSINSTFRVLTPYRRVSAGPVHHTDLQPDPLQWSSPPPEHHLSSRSTPTWAKLKIVSSSLGLAQIFLKLSVMSWCCLSCLYKLIQCPEKYWDLMHFNNCSSRFTYSIWSVLGMGFQAKVLPYSLGTIR